MYSNQIKSKLDKISDLPTMLNIALEIERLAKDPKTSISKISKIIKVDPALTGKILRISNSALYASSKESTTIQQSIARIGFDEVRRIAVSIAVLNSFKNNHVAYERFWIHSITTAYIATELVSLTKLEVNSSEVFSCGILHDIGILILDQYFTEFYSKVFSISAKRKFELQLVEKKILGITHSEVGAHVFQNWKLPDNIIDAVAYHHLPQNSDKVSTKIIYLANFICNNRGYDNGTGFFPERFYDDIWDDLGLDIEKVSKKRDKT